jgi:hypothetical protein
MTILLCNLELITAMSESTSRALFLLHIRKTGGTSYKHFLYNRFSVQESFLRAHFTSQQETDPNDFRFVSGIVDHSYISRFKVKPHVLLCLRDPLERTLSEYFYQRSEPLWQHLLDLQATPGEEARATRRLGIAELFRSLTPLELVNKHPEIAQEFMGNMQSRLVAGAVAGVRLEEEDESTLLARALQNLQTCEVLALTEKPLESLQVLCHTMGWEEDVFSAQMNITVGRRKAADLDGETLSALRAGIQLDLQLYEAAQTLFEQRLTQLQVASPLLMPITPGHAEQFSFAEAIAGKGWHRREKGAEGWFCWSTGEAGLSLQTEARTTQKLSLRLIAALHAPAMEKLQLWVNDELLSVTLPQGALPGDAEAILSEDLLRRSEGRLRLVLRSAAIRPCDLSAASKDSRELGIGVSQVRLNPA